MFYDLDCIKIGKSYVKIEEDIHVSLLARHTTQNNNQCNEQLLKTKFHQVIPIEDSTISRELGLLTVNSIVKTSKWGKFLVFFINNNNKLIRLRKGSTIGKI